MAYFISFRVYYKYKNIYFKEYLIFRAFRAIGQQDYQQTKSMASIFLSLKENSYLNKPVILKKTFYVFSEGISPMSLDLIDLIYLPHQGEGSLDTQHKKIQLRNWKRFTNKIQSGEITGCGSELKPGVAFQFCHLKDV